MTKIQNQNVKTGFDDPLRLVNIIIYINVGMYLLSLLLSARGIGIGWNPLTALSPDFWSLRNLGATGVGFIEPYHRWWTLISANYLHGSLLHIFFNMIALRRLAPFVIREFGAFRFILIYSMGGEIGFWVSYMAGVTFTIGASASVCALIGAILYFSISRGGAYGKALYRQVSGWLLGLVLIGIMPGINVNNWGHGGGILGGLLLGFLLGYNEKRPETFPYRLLAYIMVIFTGFILGGVVTGAVLKRIGI